jgi:hypothetical protein
MLRRCADSVQCRLPDSILGPPKVTSVFLFGGDISRYLATKKGGVASDFFLWRQKKGGVASDFFLWRQKKGGGGGDLFGDFVLWRIFAIFRKYFLKEYSVAKCPVFFFEKKFKFFSKNRHN